MAEVSIATVSLGWSQADIDRFQRESRERFLRYFPLLAYEPFWQCFSCRSVAPIGGQAASGIKGEIYVTSRSICFSDEMHEKNDVFFKFALPLHQVLCIRLGVARPGMADPPLIDPMENTLQDPQGCLIYTRDNRVHIFYGFLSPSLCKQFYNVVDHAWRGFAHLGPPVNYRKGSEYPNPVYWRAPPPIPKKAERSEQKFEKPPPSHSQAPPVYSEAPPVYSEAPPVYSEAPPSYSEAPPSYSEAPPVRSEAPVYSEAPPSHLEAPTNSNPFQGSNPYAFSDSAPPSAAQVFNDAPPSYTDELPSHGAYPPVPSSTISPPSSTSKSNPVYPPLQSTNSPQLQNPYSFENTPQTQQSAPPSSNSKSSEFFNPYQ